MFAVARRFPHGAANRLARTLPNAPTPITQTQTRTLLTDPSPSAPSKLRRRRRHPFADLVPSAPPTAEEAVNNILYNFPPTNPSPVTRHVLNCLVSNEPGVLSRVSGILAGRGFNIESLVVSKTEVPDLSRMTIVLNGQGVVVEQARRQLEDLVPVWAVLDYTHAKIVERELLLVKVSVVPEEYGGVGHGHAAHQGHHHHHHHRAGAAENEIEEDDIEDLEPHAGSLSPVLSTSIQRQAITELARLFRGHIVDISSTSVMIELAAKSERIDAFLKLLKPFGIIEAARSGVMAMPRSPVDSFGAAVEEVAEESSDGGVDMTMLPPG